LNKFTININNVLCVVFFATKAQRHKAFYKKNLLNLPNLREKILSHRL